MSANKPTKTLLNDNSVGSYMLRAWLWFVPIVMLLTAVGFGVYAAIDGQWALAAVMGFLGSVALGLLMFHYVLVYRFGKAPGA